jgi:phage-related protein (TIGR01555 family)
MQDTLQNMITGMGTARDKTTGTRFVFTEMGKDQVEQAFRSDWISRKIIQIPADDATREWRNWQSDQKDIEQLETLEKDLNVKGKVKQAMWKARLYGGAAILIGVDQTGDLSSELDPTKIKKDGLKFLHVVSRWELSAQENDWDIESPYYGTPKSYTRANANTMQAGKTQAGMSVHPSRIVRFIGNELPDPTINQGWGDSCLQTVLDAIISAGLATASGAKVVQELLMDVVKIPELSESLSDTDYEARLNSRFAAANLMKSLYNVLIMDKEEDWERTTANLTGLPDVIKTYLAIAAGAADIPATRLLGQSPQGMNATGDSDTRNYYDRVASEQAGVLTPAMAILDEVLVRSALGTADPNSLTYEWASLWQLDEVQRATVAVQKSTVFKADVDAALIPAEILRDARINQLIEDGWYPGLEQILDDYGPLEDIPETPPGSVIGPDGQPIPPTDPRHPLHPANQAANAANNNDPNSGVPGQTNDPGTQPGKAPAVQKNRAKTGGLPSDAMAADRVRRMNPRSLNWRMAQDAIMRSLYVYRPVLNAQEVYDWADAQGITDLVSPSDMHVTLMYSRTLVDWAKIGDDNFGSNEDGSLNIKPGGMRVVEKFNISTVLCFSSSALSYRHCSLKWAGAEWDYEDYIPHITVSNEAQSKDVFGLQPYTGEIILGPEVFAEANRGEVLQDFRPFEDFNSYHQPPGSPEGGQFATAEGGGVPRTVSHVRGLQQRIKNFASGSKAQKVIRAALDTENQREAMSRAIVGAMYHIGSVDMGPDLEEAVRDQVKDFGHNAKMATALARDKMKEVVDKLVATRVGTRIGAGKMVGAMRAFARADAQDKIAEMLQKLSAILAKLEFNE